MLIVFIENRSHWNYGEQPRIYANLHSQSNRPSPDQRNGVFNNAQGPQKLELTTLKMEKGGNYLFLVFENTNI
jgi:hypothetical protein